MLSHIYILFSSHSNSHKEHIKYAESGANRALYSVLGYLNQSNVLKQTPPPVTLKLFDSLVLPILDYGSEIWGISNSTEALEKVQLRFFKTILGVRPQTASHAVPGELARFPLIIRFQCKNIKYWCKLWRKKQNSLVRKSYDLLVHLHNMGFKTWATDILSILQTCELEESFSCPPTQEQLTQIPGIVQDRLEKKIT